MSVSFASVEEERPAAAMVRTSFGGPKSKIPGVVLGGAGSCVKGAKTFAVLIVAHRKASSGIHVLSLLTLVHVRA